jgi:hypothetical protein
MIDADCWIALASRHHQSEAADIALSNPGRSDARMWRVAVIG